MTHGPEAEYLAAMATGVRVLAQAWAEGGVSGQRGRGTSFWSMRP